MIAPIRSRACGVAAAALILSLGAAAPAPNPTAQDRHVREWSGQQRKPGPPAARTQPQTKAAPRPAIPPREAFTAAEQAAATIPDIADARFWADSEADFLRFLPPLSGPWLALSSGGADGAFGAGVLAGLGAAGRRPDFALVTGVSTGALMAPFVFLGAAYDERLREAYTTLTAADIFELGGKGESFFDTWPLKDTIARRVTPQLLADIAAEHRRGRRLFVLTTNIDAERAVAWNMGVIAVHGGVRGLTLFRDVLLAATSIPGAFPPVLIEVAAGTRRFQEMHGDGGLNHQFFVAPETMVATTSDYRLPAAGLYVVINTRLQPDFQVTERETVSIIARAVATGVKTLTRATIDRVYAAARRSGIEFHIARIDPQFSAPSRGAFDPDYMKALFDHGFALARAGGAFRAQP